MAKSRTVYATDCLGSIIFTYLALLRLVSVISFRKKISVEGHVLIENC